MEKEACSPAPHLHRHKGTRRFTTLSTRLASLSVCMPAYNEEANIGAMLEQVLEVCRPLTDDLEVVVTNDGSKDRTAEMILAKAQEHPEVRLVQHEVNKGYGAAVYDAFAAATKEVIFFTDSDKQFVVQEISKLIPYLENADMVAGYRAPRRDPWMRVLYGKGWSFLSTIFFGYTVRDVDCAFKLFRREIIEKIGPDIGSRGATFSAEWLVRTKRAGYRIVEVPVTHLPRQHGSQTGARLHVISRAFKELIRFRLQLWQGG
ncbi:MAG: glycosyltransferase family 2 protein [Chloroflexi bacterium]|nr:glycosyltransferase family 2 protein [Chloroflexota bacterium]